MLIHDGILQHFQVLFCVVLLESLFFLTICVFGPSGKALVRLVWFPALALLSLQRLWFMKGSPFSSKVVVYEGLSFLFKGCGLWRALLSLQRLWFMKGSPFSSKVVVYEGLSFLFKGCGLWTSSCDFAPYNWWKIKLAFITAHLNAEFILVVTV